MAGFNWNKKREDGPSAVFVPLHPMESDGSGDMEEGEAYFGGSLNGWPVSLTCDAAHGDPSLQVVPLVLTLHFPFSMKACERVILGPVPSGGVGAGGFAAAMATGLGEDFVPPPMPIPGNTNDHAMWRGVAWEVVLTGSRRYLKKRPPMAPSRDVADQAPPPRQNDDAPKGRRERRS